MQQISVRFPSQSSPFPVYRRLTSIVFRLTREVRFGINAQPDSASGRNGFAGLPALIGVGAFFSLRVTLTGDLESQSSYLCNIQHIDRAVRELGVPEVERVVRSGHLEGGGNLVRSLARCLDQAWPGATLVSLDLALSPFLRASFLSSEPDMIRLSQRFEFSAAHRLHNPGLSDAQNVATFGKCNNPLGHGHNYELQVTVVGEPDASGVLIPVDQLERLVQTHVIDAYDHKHLNLEVPDFAQANPSVENIARAIYRRLRDVLRGPTHRLASITVWETPKTWCEYSE